ncbi:hypothetical protein E1264_23975 [Actinomadura sp. KC216]|nr:hypothetical protein E1264_23975 [Actinomadura sp. KC216]
MGRESEEGSGELEAGRAFPCPCCGYLTLDSRGNFDICDVCFWEDDGQDEHDADVVRGGPNGALSLTQARRNFAQIGACEPSMLAQRSQAPSAGASSTWSVETTAPNSRGTAVGADDIVR